MTMSAFLPSKRFWKRLAIVTVIFVAVAFIVNGVMAWLTEAKLQAKISEIRAAGDPASIADLAPEPIPADQNAAAVLEDLAPRLNEFSKDYAQFLNQSPLGKSFDEHRDQGQPPTHDEIEAIRAIIGAYPDVASGISTAAACETYASLADFSLGHTEFIDLLLRGHTTNIRTAARFADWQSEVLLADGQHEQAVERGIQLLHLARLYNAEPMLVNLLVGIAVRSMAIDLLYDSLAAGPVSPELHAALDHELTLLDNRQEMVRTIKNERALGIGAIDAMLPGDSPYVRHLLGWPIKRYFFGVLKVYDTQIEFAGRPWLEGSGTVGRGETPAGPTGYGVLADLLVPALQAAYDADARNTAKVRSLRIFNALTQFRTEQGREASGLEELSLPAEATTDPFSGEPLKLKHTDDGWIIYSVMTNGIDDGGDFKDVKDYGVAPASHRQLQ